MTVTIHQFNELPWPAGILEKVGLERKSLISHKLDGKYYASRTIDSLELQRRWACPKEYLWKDGTWQCSTFNYETKTWEGYFDTLQELEELLKKLETPYTIYKEETEYRKAYIRQVVHACNPYFGKYYISSVKDPTINGYRSRYLLKDGSWVPSLPNPAVDYFESAEQAAEVCKQHNVDYTVDTVFRVSEEGIAHMRANPTIMTCTQENLPSQLRTGEDLLDIS